MANRNCAACDELKSSAPNLIVNGLTDTECNSLANDTGLNPSNSNNDYTDLNNMNDCLIGNMADEIELYDVCDWKDYMKKFVGDAWTMFKGIICAIRGIWTNIKNLWALANKLQCQVDYLYKGATFQIGEAPADGSYVVAGQGVSYLIPTGAQQHTSDIRLTFIAGGLLRLSGSYRFYNSAFTDSGTCYNYDNDGVNPTQSKARKGNKSWGADNTYANGFSGGELISEIRIKKSQYPQLKDIIRGFGVESGGGGFHVGVIRFNEGQWAYGQHGDCDEVTGAPWKTGYSRGHKVPEGWMYIQLRMQWIDHMNANGNQYSPTAFAGMRLNQESVNC